MYNVHLTSHVINLHISREHEKVRKNELWKYMMLGDCVCVNRNQLFKMANLTLKTWLNLTMMVDDNNNMIR